MNTRISWQLISEVPPPQGTRLMVSGMSLDKWVTIFVTTELPPFATHWAEVPSPADKKFRESSLKRRWRKNWQVKNRATANAVARDWYRRHSVAVRARTAAYAKANRDKTREYDRRSYEKRKAACAALGLTTCGNPIGAPTKRGGKTGPHKKRTLKVGQLVSVKGFKGLGVITDLRPDSVTVRLKATCEVVPISSVYARSPQRLPSYIQEMQLTQEKSDV